MYLTRHPKTGPLFFGGKPAFFEIPPAETGAGQRPPGSCLAPARTGPERRPETCWFSGLEGPAQKAMFSAEKRRRFASCGSNVIPELPVN
jgi:hypothetical protein